MEGSNNKSVPHVVTIYNRNKPPKGHGFWGSYQTIFEEELIESKEVNASMKVICTPGSSKNKVRVEVKSTPELSNNLKDDKGREIEFI